MRSIFIWATAAVCLLVAMGDRSAATANPSGSFQQTCVGIRTQDGYLYANCQDVSGRYHPSELDLRQCPGGLVANNNGSLVCGPGGFGIANSMPRGSWRASCRNASFDQDDHILNAECATENGGWNRSWLDMRDCPSRLVENANGALSCLAGQGLAGNLPSGSWRLTCRNAHSDGTVLYAECDTGRGSWNATSLDMNRCPYGPVGNSGGTLYCGGNDVQLQSRDSSDSLSRLRV